MKINHIYFKPPPSFNLLRGSKIPSSFLLVEKIRPNYSISPTVLPEIKGISLTKPPFGVPHFFGLIRLQSPRTVAGLTSSMRFSHANQNENKGTTKLSLRGFSPLITPMALKPCTLKIQLITSSWLLLKNRWLFRNPRTPLFRLVSPQGGKMPI